MNLSDYIHNAIQVERAEAMKTSPQLILGELILKLETFNVDMAVVFDVNNYHPTSIDSWRGSYCELALGYGDAEKAPMLSVFLCLLKGTVGQVLTGYKGGDYLMGKITPVWVANYSECGGFRKGGETAVVDVIVKAGNVVIKTKALKY